MRRWIWLLAVPYVVEFSSGYPYRVPNGIVDGWNGYSVSGIICKNKEVCEDIAEALNEAHLRREQKEYSVLYSTGTIITVPTFKTKEDKDGR